MPTNHRAAKAAAAAILALTAGATMATAPASAAPPYLSMTSEIRMTPVGASRTDRGYFNEQVIYIAGVVSMSKAAAQDTVDHNETPSRSDTGVTTPTTTTFCSVRSVR